MIGFHHPDFAPMHQLSNLQHIIGNPSGSIWGQGVFALVGKHTAAIEVNQNVLS